MVSGCHVTILVVGFMYDGYSYINHGLLSTFIERWHTETCLFHLSIGKMYITLDDVSCLIHLLIQGKLLNYSNTRKPEALDMMMTYLGVGPEISSKGVK